MSDLFAPKEIIPPGYQQLEILSVEKTEQYGPQVAFKNKVIGGKYDGYIFVDYASRDEDTGQIKQGTKAWGNPPHHQQQQVECEDCDLERARRQHKDSALRRAFWRRGCFSATPPLTSVRGRASNVWA